MRGGLVVCGASSDAGKSWLVAGLCRWLARRGVAVAPFKAQNMALNAAVTAGGGEIGHAQWVQAIAAGVEPEVAMNPVLLKPMGGQRSEVVVRGRSIGMRTAGAYHSRVHELWPTVLDALADLRSRFDVVVCEGAGGAAEINLLDRDLANLPLAARAGLPAIVVGDIDRGGVFASLYGTVALVPDELRRCVRGFVINKLRGDPGLLGDGCAELARRSGVPVLGVVPMLDGTDLDAEDSLALDRWGTGADAATVDVVAVRFPHVANFGDLDPLRLEPAVRVRWVRSAAELGRPHLVVLPGSKATRADLEWFRASGLDRAVRASGAAVLGVCAGLQMLGTRVDDPEGVEGPPGAVDGLGWLAVETRFARDKVLDRPVAHGYRMHRGRVSGSEAATWFAGDDGEPLGWRDGQVAGTTLHGCLEDDAFRAEVLTWATGAPFVSQLSFTGAREARLDRIADAVEAHLDLAQLEQIIDAGDEAAA